MYEARVLLTQSETLVSRGNGEACLDLAGKRLTQEMLGPRTGPIYKVGEEVEGMSGTNIKKMRRSKVVGATPWSEVQLDVFEFSRQPTSDCRQFEGSPHPEAFTANCPHRDSGMKEFLLLRGPRKESGVFQGQARECAGCAREECFREFFGGTELRIGKKIGFKFLEREECSDGRT